MASSQKGRNPKYQGAVQTSDREAVANIALWEYENVKGSENAPLFTGSITMRNGKKYKVSLWRFNSKNDKENAEL